jgi:alpha-galactosidase
MQKTFDFYDRYNCLTSFVRSDDALQLTHLCGLECDLDGEGSGPERTRGLLLLETAAARFVGSDFRVIAAQAGANNLEVEAAAEASSLLWKSSWNLQPGTGIWSRRDVLVNTGKKVVRLTRALARFPFAPARLELYAQGSTWAHENQGSWVALPAGELTLRSQAGRTNQGASPYLFLCPQGKTLGLAFHILPRGNWVIHVNRSETAGNPDAPFTVVELGLSDDLLRLALGAGAVFELPEILVQAVPSGAPEMGAPALHRYTLERFFPRAASGLKTAAPLVYNTWFDAFEVLEVRRLRQQLAAAKEVGCEVFVVDAGWYGNGAGPWDRQIGDWREKQESAFHGHMADFADEVRAAGLGFGLWMEPERATAEAPVARAHPDWFLPCPGGYLSPDLSRHPVYKYLLTEISRLVETYRLAWLKVDFNLEMGRVPDGQSGYYQAWYNLLDELRRRFPETFFEGCASGGMRLDLNTLAHFDGHFLSDTVNPVDMLRITQGALLCVPPGRLTRWAVLRPAGRLVPRYGLPLDRAPERVITPGGGNWEEAVVADVDFVCRAALPGMFGFSGDLAGLSAEVRARLRSHGEFYKRWREFITGSVGHLLTPIRKLSDREGWVGFQLQSPDGRGASLVLIYRLDDGVARKSFPLRDLDPEHRFVVTSDDAPDQPPIMLSGRELSSPGLPVELPSKFSAGLYILRP